MSKYLMIAILCTALCVIGIQSLKQKVETTTRYTPPTVPTVCNPGCETYPDTERDKCDCHEQFDCVGGRCQCDFNKQCPFHEDNCAAQCGCIEKCVCPTADSCTCNDEIDQCPFDGSRCVAICGCERSCDCVDEERTSCTCKVPCTCAQPPFVCPFPPEDCVERCGCKERCKNTCFGELCRCDPDNACP